MKKIFLLTMITFTLIVSPIYAGNDPYQDWEWTNGTWVYTGSDPVPPPPPPIRI